MLPWTCLVRNLISHIPSVRSLEVLHAINMRPISMKLTWSMLNDPRYTHAKTHINLKWLSYKFWYWTKTAITFGEECTIHNIVCKMAAVLYMPHRGLDRMAAILQTIFSMSNEPQVQWSPQCNAIKKASLHWRQPCVTLCTYGNH